MKILVTGTRGLAAGLQQSLQHHSIVCVSKTTGHNILDVDRWAADFIDMDVVVNCAYDGLGQVKVLEYFYNQWKTDASKIIVNIGSKCIVQPRIELEKDWQYWPYRLHKQFLQTMHDNMSKDCECNLKIINLGAIDTDMTSHLLTSKLAVSHASDMTKFLIENPELKRIDLWA